ncbi:hypothetical protein NS220_06025 [Microbacterium testaceum]|uniref:Uncharacterized protein n=1 Tax=Microbacterium testaceum TaxID=2033 RepID=A0A147EZC5_MICTE|nr:hypothetical protein [Microbacterium testaceum]KTR95360.1 hypothetical protein NS220_06025 [Microbacterium testaceum]
MQTEQRMFIAENFLRIHRADPNPTAATDTYYLCAAARYGLSLERISELSGIPLNRVAILVNG